MRNFVDENGRIAWIFDESTHPKGNAKKEEEKKVIPVPIYDSKDLNKDGVVDDKDLSLAGKVLKTVKGKKK